MSSAGELPWFHESQADVQPCSRAGNIVLVCDETTMLGVARMAMQSGGHEVVASLTSAEEVTSITNLPFDVIVEVEAIHNCNQEAGLLQVMKSFQLPDQRPALALATFDDLSCYDVRKLREDGFDAVFSDSSLDPTEFIKSLPTKIAEVVYDVRLRREKAHQEARLKAVYG